MNASISDSGSFVNLMERLTGCFSTQQANDLRELASQVGYGWILEVGSYRGMSAVALWTGARKRRLPTEPAVYCVEPHEKFRGVYGGQFGPEDRKAFYQAMIETGAYEGVALLNQKSPTLAPGWNRPLGLLLIDGDHTYEGVKSDFACWEKFVLPGGRVVFDDAADPKMGPFKLIKEIIAKGDYSVESESAKLVTLRKRFYDDPPEKYPKHKTLDILVACTRLAPRGGYIRFERVAHELKKLGHSLTFATLADQQDENWRGKAPIIRLEDAFQRQWDVTMIPGVAGFNNPKTRPILNAFRSPKFGFRVQHLLNDQTRADEFRSVNLAFRPHLVLFNNHHWRPGEYTQFQANQFRRLPGAVDVELFSKIPYRPIPQPGERIWIGGQCQKHPVVMLDMLRRLPENFGLRLFGPEGELASHGQELRETGRLDLVGCVHGEQLLEFYDSVELVVSMESSAGWANVGAEALASGKPLVCTRPGTATFAIHRETAIVVDQLDAGQFANQIQELVANRDVVERIRFNGRTKIASASWEKYTRDLVDLCRVSRNADYYHAPECNLFGKWPLEDRLDGLQPVLDHCQNRTVLDLGVAEGAIARQFLSAGARQLHGFELKSSRVDQAKRLCHPFQEVCEFRTADLNQWNSLKIQNRDLLLDQYDIVSYLGIHHHLDPKTRNSNLRDILNLADEYFVIRTPRDVYVADRLDELIQSTGFQPIASQEGNAESHSGDIHVFRKQKLSRQFVSFPKSGRSWLRFALHHCGVAKQIQFHHDDFEFNTSDRPPHDFSMDSRKRTYNSSHRIVYLQRNPLDVMASFYHQVTGRFQDYHAYKGSPSEFIRDPYFGASVLQRFRTIWSELADSEHVLLVNYEDCHSDFAGCLRRIMDHFKLPFEEIQLNQASESATFNNMKTIESGGQFSEPWLRTRNGSFKVRDGKIGGYRKLFSQEDIEFMESIFHS